MRAITRRATGVAVALGSITAAISLAGIGTAQAHDGHHGSQGCGRVGIEHSVDGGQTWTTNGRMDGDPQPATVQVRLTGIADDSKCSYTVSLASYSAEGPTWETSGAQQFLGWDTTTLNAGNKEATLSVKDTAPPCFGQIDLYGNGTKYDGSSDQAALPHYPNSATPTNLITAWNGGHKCDEQTTPPASPTTDTPSPSDSPTTDSPSPSDSPTTDSPSPSSSPTTTAPAVGDTSSPSPSASATGSTTAPTGTPSVPPSSGNLAETGGNGTQTVAFAAGGAALLVAGGAAVYFTRRRKSAGHSH
ncbi:LPXTG-motif cell wall anchor domain-containing protein [Actinacidiphila rubida]|uniref:LPXTG-motif cell wall anchor domain-containing protein n=1 Tax=Actinacidiphila rubida TaxID=310780 RepID=A0A1H8QSN4_9ACTN|nr:LAETG motif-containing sortase-dependent surface protein [Actinacidiphila rubida]SEO57309.1 LPXTG-motif cell wall anchor domain-containing protein [Actinacidiphila rubida]